MGTVHAPGAMVLLTRLAKVVYRRSDEEALGMRLRWYVALSFLNDHDGASQQALGEALCVDANNLVLLLNELEAAEYAERRRDPLDRRRHLVHITASGRRALDRAEHAQEAVEDEVLAALDASERSTLRDLLARALDDAGPGVC
jgi:DNA-binding MarR family transcriptional regulator